MKKSILLIFLSVKIFSYGVFSEDFNSGLNNNPGEMIINTTINNSEIKGIQQTSSAVPNGYYLSKNSINQFNDLSKIYFSIPKQQIIRIVVLNILGQEVDEILNGNINAGTYKLSYNSKQLSSGVYIYRLQTEGINEAGRMLLIK